MNPADLSLEGLSKKRMRVAMAVDLACDSLNRLQLRHSAGLGPASRFTPWHPGLRGTTAKPIRLCKSQSTLLPAYLEGWLTCVRIAQEIIRRVVRPDKIQKASDRASNRPCAGAAQMMAGATPACCLRTVVAFPTARKSCRFWIRPEAYPSVLVASGDGRANRRGPYTRTMAMATTAVTPTTRR